MPYKKMYLCLFNAVTDALRELEKHYILSAKLILQNAQQRTEETFMDGIGTAVIVSHALQPLGRHLHMDLAEIGARLQIIPVEVVLSRN